MFWATAILHVLKDKINNIQGGQKKMNIIQEGQKDTEVLSVTLQRTAKYNTIFSTLDVVRIRRNWSYSPLTIRQAILPVI